MSKAFDFRDDEKLGPITRACKEVGAWTGLFVALHVAVPAAILDGVLDPGGTDSTEEILEFGACCGAELGDFCRRFYLRWSWET